MTFPNYKDKYKSASLVTAQNFADYYRTTGQHSTTQPPAKVIILYQTSNNNYVKSKYGVNNADGHMHMANIVTGANKKIGVVGGFGIGAPALTLYLELMISWGVKEFISIGTAGSISPALSIGDIVVCNKSIRDEGVSHHYLPPEKYAYASEPLTLAVEELLKRNNLPFKSGPSWTTDAPYMETIAEVEYYQQEGVLVVEMENAALFAISKYRDVQATSITVVSDDLSKLKWSPHFHDPKVSTQMKRCIDLIVNE